MKDIFEAARAALDSHEIKIRSANEDLIASKELLRGTTGASLVEYETMTSEVGAREDKLNELKLQRKEFKCFLSDLTSRLEKVKFDQNFEAKVLEIRKYLGIECNRLKCALPMYARRSDILDVVEKNQVSVILGETGSGKSTQMAQYIYQAGFTSGGGGADCMHATKKNCSSESSNSRCFRDGILRWSSGWLSSRYAKTKVLECYYQNTVYDRPCAFE